MEQNLKAQAGRGPRLVRLPVVMEMTGLSRSSIYQKINEGRFPKPVNVSDRGKRWVCGEIEGWIAARVAERDESAK